MLPCHPAQVYGPGPGARPPVYMSAQNPRPMTPQQQGGYGRGAPYQQPQQPAPAAQPSAPVQQGYQMQPQQGYAPQQPTYAQPAYAQQTFAQPGAQTGYAQASGQPLAGYAVQQPQQVAARPVMAQQAVMQSYAPQPLQAAGVSHLEVPACSARLRRQNPCAVLLVALQNAMLPADV